MHGYEINMEHQGCRLCLYTPQDHELRRYAETLARFYNDPYNRVMMSHTTDYTPADVVSMYTPPSIDTVGFLIEVDGALLGDADLRHIDRQRQVAEYAVMIGERSCQGKGWGTMATIVAAYWAFTELGLQTIYLTVTPENESGQRCYEKVGFRPDDSPAGRDYKDQTDDIVMSMGAAAFTALHHQHFPAIAIRRRPTVAHFSADSRA